MRVKNSCPGNDLARPRLGSAMDRWQEESERARINQSTGIVFGLVLLVFVFMVRFVLPLVPWVWGALGESR
jgi:hypothetical protein